MKRSKKVVFTVHCLLNQNARAKTVAKCPGAVKEFLDFCIENDYGIIPIDCPQLMFEPLERDSETKEFYDNEKSRSISRKISIQVVDQIKLYQGNGYQVCGVFGVEGSPTCGAIKTHIKNNDGKVISIFDSGIFFEELKTVLKQQGVLVDIYDWDIQAKKAISK